MSVSRNGKHSAQPAVTTSLFRNSVKISRFRQDPSLNFHKADQISVLAAHFNLRTEIQGLPGNNCYEASGLLNRRIQKGPTIE